MITLISTAIILSKTVTDQTPTLPHETVPGLLGPKRVSRLTGTDRNGPERTETDQNGPKRTFVDTETDFLGTETDFSGYRNGPRRTGTDRNGPKRTFVDTEMDFLGTETDFSRYQNTLWVQNRDSGLLK